LSLACLQNCFFSYGGQQSKDSEERLTADQVFDPSIILQAINEGNHPIAKPICISMLTKQAQEHGYLRRQLIIVPNPVLIC
jgi:hypothetical protein